MIIQGNASDFVFRVNEGCQCLQKSDGWPGKNRSDSKNRTDFGCSCKRGVKDTSLLNYGIAAVKNMVQAHGPMI